MHSPAFAIAWQLWTRHRTGIVIAVATLVAMLASSPLLPLVARMIASSIVLAVVIGYFMNILLFTDSIGNLGSTYPRRMYALPVPSGTLVAWPMLFGGGVVAFLWVTGACLIYRPSGFATPVLLPALGLATVLIWLQTLAWSPIKNSVLKLIAPLTLVPLLVGLPLLMLLLWRWGLGDAAVKQHLADVFAVEALPTWIMEPVVFTLLVAYIIAAYAVARSAVTSDRRGDTWQVLPRRFQEVVLVPRSLRRRRELGSPAEAQFWYEWDCHGLVIPIICGMMTLVWGVTLTAFVGIRHPGDFWIQLTILVLLPVFSVGGLSISVGGLRPPWVKSREFITFLATRPITSGAMVAAKWRMAALSVLLTYAILAVELVPWVVASGYTTEVAGLRRLIVSTFPGWRAAAVLLLGVVTLPALTWSQLAAGFPIVLAGRNSLLVGLNLAVIAGAMGFGAAVIGLTNQPDYLERLIDVVPWLVAAAAVIKVIIASLAFRACLRLGLMGTKPVIAMISFTVALAGSAFALAALLAEARVLYVPMSVVLLGVVMLVPLGRLALAPLALEWNRHR